MSSFGAVDTLKRFNGSGCGTRKLGDVPIPRYPFMGVSSTERTRASIARHFMSNPQSAPAVLGMNSSSTYSASKRQEVRCAGHCAKPRRVAASTNRQALLARQATTHSARSPRDAFPLHAQNKLKFLETNVEMHLPSSSPASGERLGLARARPALVPASAVLAARTSASAADEEAGAVSSDTEERDAAHWQALWDAENRRRGELHREVRVATSDGSAEAALNEFRELAKQARPVLGGALPTLSSFDAEQNRSRDRSTYTRELRRHYGNDWKLFTAQQRIDVPTDAAREGASEARRYIERVNSMKVIQKRPFVHLPSNGPL